MRSNRLLDAEDLRLAVDLRDDGCPVLSITGELDVATAEQLEGALDELVAPGREVVVDLRGVAFCDSVGLHVLLRAHRRAGDVGCDLRMANPMPPVRSVFEVTGLGSLLADPSG